MKMDPRPLRFKPVYKPYPWGGKFLPERYRRTDAPEVCAESWEISGHPDGMSVVDGGPYDGARLDTLVERFAEQLIGWPFKKFPLLFKIINARERLSVQVHPSGPSATAHGGEAKSEMWYMLGPGAIYAGLREGTMMPDLLDALDRHSVASLLTRHEMAEGEAIFIPGGLIHAIDAGSLIYEVQQCSNTTYRLYDWGRVDRELHIEQGMRVIGWHLRPSVIPRQNTAGWSDVIRNIFFHMRRLRLLQPTFVATDGTFHALFVKRGAARLEAGDEIFNIASGDSILVPACCASYTLIPADSDAEILVTTL